jgi:hypothetical protein
MDRAVNTFCKNNLINFLGGVIGEKEKDDQST